MSASPATAAEQRVMLIDLARRFGGTESRVLHLATELGTRGATVLVVCLAESMLHTRLRDVGVRCAPVRIGRADPRLLLRLRRLIRAFRPTVVDTHGVHSQFWGVPAARLRRRVPTIVTVHSEYGMEQAGLRRARAYEWVLRLARWTRARYIAVSGPVRTYLTGLGVAAERIDLVTNAVPPPDPAALGDRAATRRQLGLPPAAFVVTTVARLHPAKGLPHLVAAMAELRSSLPQLRLLLVGDGQLQEELAAQVAAAELQDRVLLLGFRDDVPALLHASDAFVLPSLTEGLPLVVPEATLQGLPVIATEVGGLPDAYRQGEVVFVPPADPDALAAAIHGLVVDDDAREHLARRGEAATRDRLSTDTMIAATLAAYADARVTAA